MNTSPMVLPPPFARSTDTPSPPEADFGDRMRKSALAYRDGAFTQRVVGILNAVRMSAHRGEMRVDVADVWTTDKERLRAALEAWGLVTEFTPSVSTPDRCTATVRWDKSPVTAT